MNETLFEIEESLSPRLKWLKEYGFSIHYNKDGEDEPYECVWGSYDRMAENVAMLGDSSHCLFTGATEAEAIERAIEHFNLTPW